MSAYAPAIKSNQTVDIAKNMTQFSEPSTILFQVAKQVVIPLNFEMMVPVSTS